mgnify:FL=1
MERFVLIPYSLYQQKFVSFDETKLGLLDKKSVVERKTEVDSSKVLDRVYKNVSNKAITKGHVNQILSSPRIKLSQSDTIILDGRETFVPVIDFLSSTRKREGVLPDIYITILDAVQYNPSSVINKDAKSKDRGNWIPFKI